MKLAGSAVLGIDRDRVWSALQNPAVLVRTIPGCRRLEETAPDTYRMTVTAGVASIKGLYEGEVALTEPDAPQRFVLRARGQGAPGTVDATVEVRLSEVEGGTRIDYDAEAVVGGMIGGVGQRVLGSVARKTAGEFFAAVESHLAGDHLGIGALSSAGAPSGGDLSGSDLSAGDRSVGDRSGGGLRDGGLSRGDLSGRATAQSPGVAAGVFERPAERSRQGGPAWPVLAAFGMGAGVALGSAVIGWLLGRTGRKG